MYATVGKCYTLQEGMVCKLNLLFWGGDYDSSPGPFKQTCLTIAVALYTGSHRDERDYKYSKQEWMADETGVLY